MATLYSFHVTLLIKTKEYFNDEIDKGITIDDFITCFHEGMSLHISNLGETGVRLFINQNLIRKHQEIFIKRISYTFQDTYIYLFCLSIPKNHN